MNKTRFNFREFNTRELTDEEMLSINGGESGWYYLGQAYYWVEKQCKTVYNAVKNTYDMMTTPSGGGGCCS